MPYPLVHPQFDSVALHLGPLAVRWYGMMYLLAFGLFLLGYGSFRFIAEFAREADDFLSLLSLGLSMGQWLSPPMIIGGGAMLRWAYRK